MENQEISDELFDNYLLSLGVQTHNKSFEWLFNDSELSQVLLWMYNNLDHNNALSPHEEYRYAEIVASEALLTPKDLEHNVASILEEYKGLCLPGDKEGLEEMKKEISNLQERLGQLEAEENALNKILKKNDKIKEEASVEMTKLNAALHQCKEDQEILKEECLSLSQQVETATEDVVQTVANMLNAFSSCDMDKEMADNFLAFGTYDTYRHKQDMFRSLYDSFVNKMFGWIQNDTTEEDFKVIITEAKIMEERLTNAIFKYISSRTELFGEQAKLNVLCDFIKSEIGGMNSASIGLNQPFSEHQAETLLEEVKHLALRFVKNRTKMVTDAAADAALSTREQINSNLNFLYDITSQCFLLDKILYQLLRREFSIIVEFLQFADQLRMYLLEENEATVSRIDSMKKIQSQQQSADAKTQKRNEIAEILSSVLGFEVTGDPLKLVKQYDVLSFSTVDLRSRLAEAYNLREKEVDDLKTKTAPLKNFIWDGSTRQPNCRDSTVTSLSHTLIRKIAEMETKVVDCGKLLASVKNSDKDGLRKMWQWFLTDQDRFMKELTVE